MKKVYVVTSGEYSDYGINAIFSEKEIAEQFVSLHNKEFYDDMRVEEWVVDSGINHIKEKLTHYSVYMTKKGETISIRVFPSSLDREDYKYVGSYKGECVAVHCWAKDEQHAIKIANEKRIQILANNLWGKERELKQNNES